jgi:hypothetical protein
MSAPVIKIKRGTTVPTSLLAGELAVNTAAKVLYVGDGTNVVTVGGDGAFVDKSSAQTIGGVKTFSETIVGSVNGNAATATALATGRDIAVTGDASGTATSFNGTANAEIALTLANSGVSAGTHTKVTVDAKGRVTVGAELAASDIPTLTAEKISDFDTQVRTSRLDQMAAPTASVALNSQKITGLADPTSATDAANKGFVDGAISNLVNGAGEALDTLKELADALGNDANFSTTVANSIGEKLAKASNLSDLSDASVARTNLGVAIGSDVQAYDAGLQSIAGLTTSADQLIYATAADTYATSSLTSFGRSLLDDADAAAGRSTLGLGTISTQAANDVNISGGAVSGVTFSNVTIDCGTY